MLSWLMPSEDSDSDTQMCLYMCLEACVGTGHRHSINTDIKRETLRAQDGTSTDTHVLQTRGSKVGAWTQSRSVVVSARVPEAGKVRKFRAGMKHIVSSPHLGSCCYSVVVVVLLSEEVSAFPSGIRKPMGRESTRCPQ